MEPIKTILLTEKIVGLKVDYEKHTREKEFALELNLSFL